MVVRRQVFLPLSLLALSSFPGVAAAASAGAQPSASSPGCESKLAAKYPLPATLPAADLIRDIPGRPLATSATEIEIVCGVFARQWKSQRAPSYLVFLETETFRQSAGKPEPVGYHLRAAVYRQEGDGQYRLAARSVAPLALANESQLDDVDLAPYRMTDTDFAFGVRTTAEFDGCEGSYCSGSSGFLQLFRVDGKAIRPILTTLLWSEAHTISPAKDDFSRDHETLGDTTPAGISVLKTRTAGVFDWKKSKRKKTAIFRWTGERYESTDEDPVIDQSR